MLPECTHTGPGSHECICHPGYDSKDNGTNYAAIAECDSNPCQNNATCVRRDQEMKLEAALLHLDESRVAHDEAEEVAAKEEVRLIEAAAHADVEGIDHEEHLGLKLSVSNRVQQRLLFQHQRELRPPSKPLFLFPTHHPCKDKFSLCIKIQQWAATTTRSDHTARIGVPNTREQCGVQGCVPFLISHQVRVPIFVSPLLACKTAGSLSVESVSSPISDTVSIATVSSPARGTRNMHGKEGLPSRGTSRHDPRRAGA